MRTRISASCVFGIAALLLPVTAWAQTDASPFDGYTPGQAMPGSPAGSYALSGFDTVNPANGIMSLNLPLLTVKGRGSVSVPLTVSLNNEIWDTMAVQYQGAYGYVVTTAGWDPLPTKLGVGRMLFRSAGDYCTGTAPNQKWNTVLTRGVFVAPDGTETEFVDQQTNGTAEAGTAGYNRGTIFISDNGSFAKFTSSSSISDPVSCSSAISDASGTLVLRDGTSYTIGGGYVGSIRDRNGNITYSSSNGITDSVGRVYQTVTGSLSGRNYEQVQYTGAGGAQRIITIWYAPLDQVSPGEPVQTLGQLWPGIPASSPASNLNQTYDPIDRISEIDLPDGSKYLFTYHAYGDVAQITLPTGGIIQYDYNAITNSVSASPVTMYVLTRSLKERREILGGSIVSKTDYLSANGEIDHYDVNGTLVSKETHSITNGGTLPSSGTNYNSSQYNQQSVANYYDAGGSTLLESQTTVWAQQNCMVNCSTPQSVTTTRNGTVKQTAYAYDAYNNVSDQKDYDWGIGSPGALLRDTQTSYSTSSTFITINILGLPTETKVFDGSNNLYADTKYGYDGNGMSNDANINGTFHDNVNFNGSQPRGNLTSAQPCSTTSGSSCSAWLPSTTYWYDIAGNVVNVIDANGHNHFLNYADAYADGQNRYTYAFVTLATNALGQTASWQYDFGTGKPVTAQDINSQQRTYSYNDPLDRLTQTHSPNGANSYDSYPDAKTVIAQQDQNAAGDAALKSRTLYDGFGRVQETDTYEGASHYIATTQTYDALGRVATTTNPSRPGDGLNYTTTYGYDGLGRPTKVTTPDGAVAATTYTANSTTATDAGGHARTVTTDALGNVLSVTEDPTSRSSSQATRLSRWVTCSRSIRAGWSGTSFTIR